MWYRELNENANKDIKIILVGNKTDLKDKRKVEDKDIEKCIKDYDVDYYIETSAKTGENVEKLFVECCKILYKEYLSIEQKKKKIEENNNKIKLEDTNQETNEQQNSNGCLC